MTDEPSNGTALPASLALVPDGSLQEVADAAVAGLRAGHPAADLIVGLSLQAPHTLRPHLERLWDLAPNSPTYSACWPWRGADDNEIDRLAARLHAAPAESDRAWRCLLETRMARGWSIAVAAIGGVVPAGDYADACLNLVGIERRAGGIRRLVTEPTCHIEFPQGFLVPPGRGGGRGAMPDPSWYPGSGVAGAGRFGGEVDARCAVCGGPLHRLLAFDQAPANVPGGLQVVTCLSCLGWSQQVLYFAHHGTSVRPAGPALTRQRPEFPAEALPETPVRIRPSSPRWRRQDWAYSNGEENLHRVGGEPTWIQSAEFPACPACHRTMRFLLQLDSLEIEGGPWWLWGSGGILYSFWCDGCSLSATLWQCT
ncbi:hypothetical protein ACFO1B_02395 [Dactylosporangium siamense]|uniref:DUF1963 domain-containing protein n=1 Tax=Dactylosporangium siamense TaxID=685454 RepID=A0A919PU17_9ACTN|nr:hypothetical protein [Dactylosporangium siamense]GIG48518.1 hypothetical protein Dsi01nite_065590 [Dactylosporangium siamense]